MAAVFPLRFFIALARMIAALSMGLSIVRPLPAPFHVRRAGQEVLTVALAVACASVAALLSGSSLRFTEPSK